MQVTEGMTPPQHAPGHHEVVLMQKQNAKRAVTVVRTARQDCPIPGLGRTSGRGEGPSRSTQPVSVKSSVSSVLLAELCRAGSDRSAKALPLAASARTWALGMSTLPLSTSGLAPERPGPQRESPDMARDARSSTLLLPLCSALCTLYVVICAGQDICCQGVRSCALGLDTDYSDVDQLCAPLGALAGRSRVVMLDVLTLQHTRLMIMSAFCSLTMAEQEHMDQCILHMLPASKSLLPFKLA